MQTEWHISYLTVRYFKDSTSVLHKNLHVLPHSFNGSFNEILLSIKMEHNTDIHNDMNDPQNIRLSEKTQEQKSTY